MPNPVDVTIKGGEQMKALARSLKEAGDGRLRREVLAGVRRATNQLPGELRSSALSVLPSRGGLAARVAAARMGTHAQITGTAVKVQLDVDSRYNVAAMDRGRVRHPVFKNRDVWVSQRIPSGWFTEPVKDIEPEIRRAVERAMRQTAAKVTTR